MQPPFDLNLMRTGNPGDPRSLLAKVEIAERRKNFRLACKARASQWLVRIAGWKSDLAWVGGALGR